MSVRILITTLKVIQKMAHSSFPKDIDKCCRRLELVEGNLDCFNDVLVAGSLSVAKQHVIFFGGDVQDFRLRMLVHNEEYSKWNLEYMTQLMMKRFPDSAVFVVKPAEMYLHSFSIYRNFLKFDDACPVFSNNYGGLPHLQNLYKNSLKRYLVDESKTEQKCEPEEEERLRVNNEVEKLFNSVDIPIVLVGFSKGCTILNQIVFESQISINAKTKKFLRRISSAYWLDGGHSGGQNAWITNDETLEHLKKLKWKLYAHITPYQVHDPIRKWIGREEREFVSKLKNMEAPIEEKIHLEKQPRSISNHFQVLELF